MNIQVPAVESAETHQLGPALLPLPNDDDALIRARDVSRHTGIARQTHAAGAMRTSDRSSSAWVAECSIGQATFASGSGARSGRTR